MIKYKKGQRLQVPRSVRPHLEMIIGIRTQYMSEAFREIGEAFGMGGKDIGEHQTWMFFTDREEWVAWVHEKGDETRKPLPGTGKISIDEIAGSIAKLEMQDKMNPLVIHIINLSVRDIFNYFWRLQPDTMEIEILSKKPKGKKTIPSQNENLKPIGGLQ